MPTEESTSSTVLAADIGGTNARFQVFFCASISFDILIDKQLLCRYGALVLKLARMCFW